ncbi:hypothetical protein NUKP2_45470 [Klebsiella quasipneumoniae]|nr:hypothetical protein NUKP2_45470 [Klebsiella quasipneumoniae]
MKKLFGSRTIIFKFHRENTIDNAIKKIKLYLPLTKETHIKARNNVNASNLFAIAG